ncbi:MAG: acyl carrier protein [Phycisphaerae bacterium]|nr:acyl carrier protein [Phycisphaerae bacterium]
MQQNMQTLSAVFQEVVGFGGALKDDLKPVDVPGWDSVAHISIVEAIEQRFGVRLTTEQMLEMTSIAKIKSVLREAGVEF